MKLTKVTAMLIVLALCATGCKESKNDVTVKPTDVVTPTMVKETVSTEEIIETESTTEPSIAENQSSSSFAGEMLVESTEAIEPSCESEDGQNMTEPAEETKKEEDEEDTKSTEPEDETEIPTDNVETMPEETQGGSAIPENNYEGDLLEPPSEGSDDVL